MRLKKRSLHSSEEINVKDQIKINDRLTSGKQPSEEMLRKLQQQGYKTVINLRTSGEEDMPMSPVEEGRIVHDLDMEYVHIPISSEEGPKAEQVDRFREEVEQRQAPIFTHCHRGKRSGALSLIHVALQENMTGEQAYDRAEELGYECDVPKLKEFFINYIDKRGRTLEEIRRKKAKGKGKKE
jgi:uncharacterized protein (TIGR01244 family)